MEPIKKVFSCSFQIEGKPYLIKVDVEAKDKKAISNKALIRDIVEQAIGYEGYLQRKDKNIRILIDRKIRYFYGQDDKATVYEEKATRMSFRSFRMVELANRILPKRDVTFSENIKSLWSAWPKWIPGVNLAWWFVLSPLVALGRYIHPHQVFDTSSLTLKEDPHNRLALEDALQETIEVLEPYPQDSQGQLLSAMKEGLDFARKWRENPAERHIITEELQKNLIIKNQPIVLAGGYWKKDHTFEPVLWSIAHDDSGYTLTEMAYGKAGESPRMYYLGKTLDPKKINHMIYNLMFLSEKAKDVSALKNPDVYAIGFVNLLRGQIKAENSPNEVSQALVFPAQVTTFKEAIIVEGGGTPLVEESEVIKANEQIKEDPLKLIYRTIMHQFPQAELRDKAMFSLHILYNRLTKVLSALPDMSDEEQQYWLDKLDKDYESLKRQFQKAQYGSIQSTFEMLGQHLEMIKKEKYRLEEVGLQAQQKRMEKLDHVSSSPYKVQVASVEKTPLSKEGADSKESKRITKEDYVELSNLRSAIEKIKQEKLDSIPIMAQSMEKLSVRMDQLIEQGEFDIAIELYRLVMPHLPEPDMLTGKEIGTKDIVRTGFWKSLASSENLAEQERSTQIKQLSDSLGKMSQCFWEAKVKTSNLHMRPDEVVYMLNTEAAMKQMIDIRAELLKRVYNANYTPEEHIFMTVAQHAKDPKEYQFAFMEKINKASGLLLDGSPVMAAKLSRITQFLKLYSISKIGDKNLPATQRFAILRYLCKRIIAASRSISPADITNEEANLLAMDFHNRKKSDKAIVPSQFADLSRHQLMYTSLIFPESSIARSTLTIRGKIAFGLAQIKAHFGMFKDLREEQLKRRKQALDMVKKYPRLEVSVYYSEKRRKDSVLGDRIVSTECGFGIVDTRHQAGKKFDVDLAVDGVSEILIAGSSFNEERELRERNVYDASLGYPGEDFGVEYGGYDKSNHDVEATYFRKFLGSDDPDALDHLRLQTCKAKGEIDVGRAGRSKVETFVPHQNLHNAFDLILQCPWLMEKMSKNSKGAPSIEGQKCFYDVVFSSGIIKEALLETPEYFISHAPLLKKMMDSALKEKKMERFYFLFFMTNAVKEHVTREIAQLQDNEKIERLKKILKVWPSAETISEISPRASYLSKALLYWQQEDKWQERIDGAAYILSYFTRHPEALSPQNVPELARPESTALLLQMANMLEIAKWDATIPRIAEEGLLWVKEQLSPHIENMDSRIRNQVLNSWTGEKQGNDWKPIEGEISIWQRGVKGSETVVDLSTMQILKIKGQPSAGLDIKLPEEVTQNSDYQFLFGNQVFASKVRSGQQPGDFVYSFKDTKGSSYRLTFTKSNRALSIERLKVKNLKNGRQKEIWLKFSRTNMVQPKVEELSAIKRWKKVNQLIAKYTGQEASTDQVSSVTKAAEEIESSVGIERQLLQSGVWVDPRNPTKGYAILNQKFTKESEEITKEISLPITFSSRSGQLKSIRTEDGWEVVHHADASLTNALSCLPREQILFLKKPFGQSINKIIFLNQSIYLERKSKDAPWILHGDEAFEGAEWVIGDNRGSVANRFLSAFGANIEQVGLTVRKGDKTHLLLWPQQAIGKRTHKEMNLEFQKEIRTAPPLKITIPDEGAPFSSSAGYLALAYLFSVKHDFRAAEKYLHKAVPLKVENGTERYHLSILKQLFTEFPASSVRTAALKLKALLAIRQIEREQVDSQTVEGWHELFVADSAISESYDLFLKQMKQSPFAAKEEYYRYQDIPFNGSELRELSYITNRSIGTLLREMHRTSALKQGEMGLVAAVPTQMEISAVLPLLVKKMAKTPADPRELIQNLELTESCVVENFFTLYRFIKQEKITPEQLQPLFGPIASMTDMSVESIKKLFSGDSINDQALTGFLPNANQFSLNIAGRLLLVAAAGNVKKTEEQIAEEQRLLDLGFVRVIPEEGNAKGSLELLDDDTLRKMQKELPSSAIALMRSGYKLYKAIENQDDTMAKNWHLLCNQITPITDVKDVVITTKGYVSYTPPSILSKVFANEKMIDLERLQAAFKEDPNLFGPSLSPILARIFDTIDKEKEIQALQETGGLIPIKPLIDFLDKKFHINLMEALREAEGKKYMGSLEKEIEAGKAKGTHLPEVRADVRDSFVKLRPDEVTDRLTDYFSLLWDPQSATKAIAQQKANLSAMQDSFGKLFGKKTGDPLQDTNNRKLLEGVKDGVEYLNEKVDGKTTIPGENIGLLREENNAQKAQCKRNMQAERNYLFAHLKEETTFKTLPKEMQAALKQPDLYGEEEILTMLEQAYQTLELTDSLLCAAMTRYLMEKAALGVLSGEVENQIKTLEIAHKQGVLPTSNEWIHAATQAHDLMVKALNFKRYLDPATGELTNPRLHRKVLVFEARKGLIATQEQLEITQNMARNPEDWYKLKVGLGKTSFVFPIVLMLLIEQGEFPTALVKGELLRQNLDSLDRSTRELLEKAGVEFSFKLNDPISPLILQEKYLRLLEVQKQKGYPITSAPSIQAVDQKLQLLNQQLIEKVDKLSSTFNLNQRLLQGESLDQVLQSVKLDEKDNDLRKIIELDELQKNIYYLSKIKEKLNFLLIDEADDVLNVTRENNVGLGEAQLLDATLESTMDHLMRILFTGKEATKELREALLAGRQAVLVKDKVEKEILPSLVRAMLSDPHYKVYLGTLHLTEADKESLITHICTVFAKDQPAPKMPHLSEDTIKKLGALKHIIQADLPTALKQQPGIEAGVKKSNGFQVGPQASGQEIVGTVFGKQQDTIVNQFLYYAVRLPDSEQFVANALSEIREQHFEEYQKWLQAAGNRDLVVFLNEPDNFEMRLQFLRFQVFEAKRIRQFEKQIVFNVQDICRGRRVGGMTGTLNRDCLPEIRPEGAAKGKRETKKEIGQVLLEAGQLAAPLGEGRAGMSTVKAVEEENILLEMQKAAKDLDNKAIINQGYFLEGGDAFRWIQKLREYAPERIYVYVDSKTRTFFIWKPGNNQPESIGKSQLNALALDKDFKKFGCFGFCPPDTRGTDFKIPPGKGVSFISPKCSMDDFIQTLGRLRGAGNIHSMNFMISKGMEKRIERYHPGIPLSYPLLVDDINRQDLEEQTGKNLKTAGQSMKSIVQMGTRQLLVGYRKEQDATEYWGSKGVALRLIDIYLKKRLMAIANDPKTGWLEERRELNLAGDFAKSVHQDITENMREVYNREMDKVQKMENAVKAEMLAMQIAVQLKLNEAEVRGWLSLQIAHYKTTLGQMKADLTTTFERIQAKINDEREQIYPATVPSSGGGQPMALAQVQEAQLGQVQQQQQQQQQQQEQQQQKSVGIGEVDRVKTPFHPFAKRPARDQLVSLDEAYKFWNDDKQTKKMLGWRYNKYLLQERLIALGHHVKPEDREKIEIPKEGTAERQMWETAKNDMINDEQRHGKKSADQLLAKIDVLNSYLKKMGHANFDVTDNFDEVAQAIKLRFQGDLSMCRILVKNNEVTLITKNDYSHAIKKQDYDAIYAFVDPNRFGQGLVLDKSSDGEDPFENPEKRAILLPKIVRAKWFLGISQYTPEELEILKVWLKEVSEINGHKIFLEQIGTKEQQMKMKEWLSESQPELAAAA